jgi:outer membrane cobalamin receptor
MYMFHVYRRLPRRCLEVARVATGSLVLVLSLGLVGRAFAQTGQGAPPAGQGAQATGQVQGKVVGEDGSAVAGVRVSVRGTNRAAVTDAHGVFRIAEVPVGQAVIVAQYVGREPAQRTVTVTAGQAAEADLTLGAVQMAAVVVSATRTTTTLAHMPEHTTVIGPEALATAPAQTLDQLLREISGVNMGGAPFYVNDPTGAQAKFRGITSNGSVLVMIDGVPVLDPFYSTTEWFKMPLSAIDHIEVVRGGSSSLWGNQAVAGVINVITKRPVDNSTQLDANYGSLNTTIPSVAQNLVLGNGLSLRLSGDVLNTAGYQTTPAQYLTTVPGKAAGMATNANAQLAAYYTPSADFNAFLRAGYHRQNEDIGGYRYGQNLQQSPDAAGGFTKTFADGARADVRFWGQYLTFYKYNGAGCYLVSATTCNTTAASSPLVQYANSHDYNPYHEFGASAILSSAALSGSLASVQGGVDWRTDVGQDSSYTFNKPTSTASTVGSQSLNRVNFGSGQQQFVGVWSQVRVDPLARLEVTASVRYDYWTNEAGIADMIKYTNGAPGSLIGGPVPSSTWGSFDPSVLLRYALDEHFSLRGGAYRSFRAPGLNNLYRSYSSSTSISIANPDLSPSTLLGGELGADLNAGIVRLGVTAFYDYTKNLITTYVITSAATAPAAVTAICGPTLSNCPANINLNTNGQNASADGLEFTGSVRPTHSVTVDASYTRTYSYYTWTSTSSPIFVQLGAIPRNLATLGLTWEVTAKWNAYVGLRYNDFMYLDVNQTVPQPSFVLVGLNLSYRLARQVELYGAVVNLTNVAYSDAGTTATSSETLGMPRTVQGGVRCQW